MTTGQQTAAVRTSPVLVHEHSVRSGIQEGYRIPFTTLPPLSHRPGPFKFSSYSYRGRRSDSQDVSVEEDRSSTREGDHSARSAFASSPCSGFFISMYLVPKPNGTCSPFHKVSQLNVHIPCPHFNIETVQLVRAAVRSLVEDL